MHGFDYRTGFCAALAILLSLLIGTAAMAEQAEERPSAFEDDQPIHYEGIETDLNLTGSYRVDNLDWNIAGDTSGENPNILSELTWEDIESAQVSFEAKVRAPKIFYFRGFVDYGWIYDGQNQDSDYAGDDRTLEFSRSNNSADDGSVLDASLGIGYPFDFGSKDVFGIRPVVGWSYHEQRLKITDGFQTIPATGAFEGLDSSYTTRWTGPWVGADLVFTSREMQFFIKRVEAFASGEYHWADYFAQATWNLREDFAQPDSFEHEADGTGFVVSAGVNLFFTRNWAVQFVYSYQDWTTDEGTDTTFFADGTQAETQLNEVNWDSQAIGVGVLYRF
jgi:opacity protein-like surface antigen